ncbi:MAG: prepilin-type N-terminal cleavage/methylation domain-containing protein [Candidatus Paceibacteria bacterium]|jgi:prepilin-type N-terminal cleavage/methylation domain-containing protein
MKKQIAGFTLIEIIVALSIVAILSSFLYASFSDAGAQSRDAQRRADLRILQSAVELYKNENGRYPAGCNDPSDWNGETGDWSGQIGSPGACIPANSQYIIGLAPKYIPVLPTDPKLNGGSGYMYTVDAEGMVYKIIAEDTVESENVDYSHPFVRCGAVNSASAECNRVPPSRVGSGYNNTGSTPEICKLNGTGDLTVTDDYALYGGYANGGWEGGSYYSTVKAREYFSDQIKCK